MAQALQPKPVAGPHGRDGADESWMLLFYCGIGLIWLNGHRWDGRSVSASLLTELGEMDDGMSETAERKPDVIF